MAPSIESTDTEYTRLHITPFNPTLVTTILPRLILLNARNISYHDIQTFPERAYGYVDLPTMDAEKIKKKLNGSILKGTKVKIDKARPQKEVLIEEPEEPKPKKEKGKKRKRDEIPAAYIGERHVKRGWTTPAAKVVKDKKDKEGKTVVKSKYTTGPECLFKTVLPLNVAVNASAKDTKPAKKKAKKPGKEAVVHEFAKTTKYATFLRAAGGGSKKKIAAEYVEGKGWVDEDGNVVEEEVKKVGKSRPKKVEKVVQAPIEVDDISEQSSSDESSADEDTMDVDTETKEAVDPKKAALEAPVETNGDASETSSDDSSSDESSVDEDVMDVVTEGQKAEKANEIPPVGENRDSRDSSDEDSDDSSSSEDDSEVEVNSTPRINPATKEASPTSSSGPSSGEDSSSDSSRESSDGESPESSNETKIIPSRPQLSSGPPSGLTIKIPDSISSTPITATEVHPLEALYKRPRPTGAGPAPKPVPSSFSFFGADDNEDIEAESHGHVPLTPFTQRDFEYRGLRSAAPTPDTAHANKRFIWTTENDHEDVEDDHQGTSSPIRNSSSTQEKADGEGKGEKEESDFQKWFYEHRGDANRAWKKRRKIVAKEKRQRENRKRQERI